MPPRHSIPDACLRQNLFVLVPCLRQETLFLHQISEIVLDIESREPNTEIIKFLMNSKDYFINKLVMKFISSFMNIRDSLLLASESAGQHHCTNMYVK